MKTCSLLICCVLLVLLGSLLARGESALGPELVLPLKLPLRLVDNPDPLPIVTNLVVPGLKPEEPAPYLCPTQFRVWIPDNAMTLIIEVECAENPDASVDLLIRYGSPITEDNEYVYFSSSVTGPEPLKRLELSDASEPSLHTGPLFLAIGTVSEVEIPVVIRLSCIVPELPEGSEGEQSALLNIPLFLVTVSDVLAMSVPVGWFPLPDERLAATTVVAFETPRVEGQPTTGRLEVGTWALNEVSTVDELQHRLEEIYMAQGGLQLVAQGEVIIDGYEARESLLIDESASSGTLFACFIADRAAWLISTTFVPLGYGEMYEQIFKFASASFRLLKDEESPPPAD